MRKGTSGVSAVPRKPWPQSVAAQVFVLQLLVMLLLAVLSDVTLVYETRSQTVRGARHQVLAVAAGFASSPGVAAALKGTNPTAELQPLAEEARQTSGVDFVAVLNRDGVRYTDVRPDLIGKRATGDFSRALDGESYTELFRGAPTVLATDVNQRYPGELTEALLAGDLDIGLCRAMTPPYGLTRTTLGEHPLNIAVAADHPLADHTSVALSDLADQRFIVWGQPGQSGYTDLLITHCRAAGFEPRTERTALQGTPPVTAVIGTDRVAFVTTAPGPAAGGAARILALTPPLYAPLHALYAPRTTSPTRDAFLTAAAL